MKLCLDTCGYSRLALHHADLIELVDNAEVIFISTIVLGELYAGFNYGKHEKKNRHELSLFLELPGVVVVNIDTTIADRYGILVTTLRKQGTPIPANDIWIAAVTLETGSRLITYDNHFSCVPGLATMAP